MDQASWSTICLQLQGKEVMVWTRGGHFYRGFMKGWNDAGYMVVERASCPLAGNERGERDWVIVLAESIDAIS